MAKVIATIGGVALKPGISRNRRLYGRPLIAAAVAKAQERINGDGMPLTMLTHHQAGDSSDRIIGRITGMSLAEDGSARFTADIADTPHGRTIASLLDTSDGEPAFLKGVSIRGEWGGKVRRVTGDDQRPAETADSLLLHGIDYTASPGVPGAAVDAFSWASDGQQETTERVLITESVEATVTFTETSEPASGDGLSAAEAVREAMLAVLGRARPANPDEGEDGPLAEADGTPPMSKRGSGSQGGGRTWADPGYQGDKKQRYDITTKDKAKAAWSYINQASKASKYTANQLKRIKGRIKAALSKFGVTVAAEGWTLEPLQITETVAEYLGDPCRAGSWCINASNGPVSLSLSSWGMDPAELDVILRAAADAACVALKKLDPDMDGDIDLPGAPNASNDGESAPDDPATATEEGCGDTATEAETSPATAGNPEGEPAMAESTTTEGGAATAGLSADELRALVAGTVNETLAARDEAARQAAETAKAEADAATAAKDAEAARIKEAVDAALAAAGVGANTGTTETAEGGTKPAVTETDDQRIARLVQEGITARVQEMVTDGTIAVARGGLLEHAPTEDEAKSAADLATMPREEADRYMGAALDKYVGDRTRVKPVHA